MFCFPFFLLFILFLIQNGKVKFVLFLCFDANRAELRNKSFVGGNFFVIHVRNIFISVDNSTKCMHLWICSVFFSKFPIVLVALVLETLFYFNGCLCFPIFCLLLGTQPHSRRENMYSFFFFGIRYQYQRRDHTH